MSLYVMTKKDYFHILQKLRMLEVGWFQVPEYQTNILIIRLWSVHFNLEPVFQ